MPRIIFTPCFCMQQDKKVRSSTSYKMPRWSAPHSNIRQDCFQGSEEKHFGHLSSHVQLNINRDKLKTGLRILHYYVSDRFSPFLSVSGQNWYWCYYLLSPRELVSPLCEIFFSSILLEMFENVSYSLVPLTKLFLNLKTLHSLNSL